MKSCGGGRPGLPVPNSPVGLSCGRKAILNLHGLPLIKRII